MPTISAFADHPTHPYVRVVINWADVPAAQYAGVSRVMLDTGECVPLRPYICYSGWELLLSCGHGVFWDTEAPFDRPFYYITTSSAAPCLPADPLLLDPFSRVEVNTWGSPDIGNPYTQFGAAAAFSVNGSVGQHSHPSANTGRTSISDIGRPNARARADFSIPELASGVALVAFVIGRWTDNDNYYMARIGWTTGNAVTVTLRKRVAAVETNLISIPVPDLVATINTRYTVDFDFAGPQLSAKLWPSTTAEPTDWQITASDTDLTTGNGVGIRTITDVGSTQTFPFVYSMDNFQVTDPCLPCTPVTADTSSTPITLVNDGRFWLKDPVRPCSDRPVPLCQTGSPLLPSCGGDDGILFVGIGAEIYAANSVSLQPMMRRRPLAITRPRGDATTSLRLQTLTFASRDDVLALVQPGSPLLFQGPSEYGVPDRYMDIRDVQVEPKLPDLRISIRSFTLPYVTVDRFAGPTQGICGARVADICELYPTLADLAATGFTRDDLVAGQASPVSANPDRRTYNDVNAEFVDYNAVNTGGRDYNELYEGA